MAVDRFGALERELVGERAAALGRVAAGMEKALDDLRQFDVAPGGDPAERAELVAIAAERVWFYVVQRESLGWYRHEDALRFYRVPAELILRMGPRRA
ncbi:MAG TPA: DUF6665 family protein [Kofleriaceae bacterium]|nr:DUF6665 family protein [Kofleriaceae bacterium]